MRDTVLTVPGHGAERASAPGVRRWPPSGCGCLMVLAVVAGACGGNEKGIGGAVPQPITVRINGPGQVTPPGQTQFAAIQTWSDGATVDVTASAQWTNTNPTVLSIGAGLATALAPGEAGLTARFDQFVSQPRTVLVVPPFPEWNGTYSLTLGGGVCTGSMPPELKQRTYTAAVGQSGLTLNVEVPNAGNFAGHIINPPVRFSLYSFQALSARRTRKRSVGWVRPEEGGRGVGGSPPMMPSRFNGTLNQAVATSAPRLRAAYWGPVGVYTPLIVEVLPDGNRLAIGGDAETTMSPSGFTGTLNGELTLFEKNTDKQLAVCASPSHVFRLVRQ